MMSFESNSYLASLQFRYARISGKENGRVKKGVLFSTYSSLIGESQGSAKAKYKTRLKQIVHWCGKDFDGVVRLSFFIHFLHFPLLPCECCLPTLFCIPKLQNGLPCMVWLFCLLEELTVCLFRVYMHSLIA